MKRIVSILLVIALIVGVICSCAENGSAEDNTEKVDIVLDTDAYNEADDQLAIAYMLASSERINCQAIYAAPFLNNRVESAKEGMEKSYNELLHILTLCGRENMIEKSYKGAESFLMDEKTPIISDASRDLVSRAKNYSKENPLYVVAIGAITNVSSALLIDPSIKDNIVVVWLGGNSREWSHTREFNMRQDIAGARVLFSSGASIVQLPCMGVVSEFKISKEEINEVLSEKNELCTYLLNGINEYYNERNGEDWEAVIWDATAIAWLINDNSKFMLDRFENIALVDYNGQYEAPLEGTSMKYVYKINTSELKKDLIEKLTK